MPFLSPTQKFIYHLACMHCEKPDAFDITWHMSQPVGRNYGPWFCGNCGKSQVLTILESGGVQVEAHKNTRLTTLDLLVLQPRSEPVYLVVEGFRLSNEGEAFEMDNAYHYNEHTCPTNFVDKILSFIVNGNDDPHGLFEFVKGVPDTRKDKTETSVREVQKLFEMDLGFPADDDED